MRLPNIIGLPEAFGTFGTFASNLKRTYAGRRRFLRRPHRRRMALGFEGLEQRAMMADLDDTFGNASFLGSVAVLSTSASDSISEDVDVDMFKFTVTAGQVVDFDIDTTQNGPGGLGSYIRLFNAQGTELAANNDGAAPGENTIGYDAYLRYAFASSGTYYLGISNYHNAGYNPITGTGDVAGGQNATGAYQLTLNALPIDTDDSLIEATSLGAVSTTASTTNASLITDVDVDMYQFTVTSGQIVELDIDTPLNGPDGLGSYIRLFNSQGTQIDFNNDGVAPGENTLGFDAYLRHTFATAGTYYLGVSNFNNIGYDPITGNGDTAGGQYTIGDYTLIVQSYVAPPNDLDDAISEATSLGAITTTPNTISNTIAFDVDVDMFRFTVTAGQIVDFDIDTELNGAGGLGSYLRLFNASGVQLNFNNDGVGPGESLLGFDSYLRYTFASAGTYYLGVSNFNNATYDPVSGNGDVSGGLNTTGAYQLTVNALPVDNDDTLIEATSLGAVTATAITKSSTIGTDIDVDMYKFTATAGQIVDIDIDTPLNGPGGLGAYLRLFNAQGTQIDFNDDGAAPGENTLGFDSYLRHTFTAAGTYYLGVSNFNNIVYDPIAGSGDTAGGLYSAGDYTLILQTYVAPPNDTDDSIGEAISLGAVTTTPNATNNSIAFDVDVDMYKFSVTAGQVVDFDIDTELNGTGGLGSYLRLFNAQGTQLGFNNDGAAPGENILGFDSYLRYTFATAGTFYLGVSNLNNTSYDPISGNGDATGGSSTTGNYQITVVALPIDTDDSMVEAKSLGSVTSTPVITNSTIVTDIDVNMVKFSVSAGQVVDIDIDTPLNGPGGLDAYIRLFDSQGTQIDANDDAAAPGENTVGFDSYLRHTFAAGGIYYLGVSNFNNTVYSPTTGSGDTAGGPYSIGDYTLSLQAYIAPPNDPDDAIGEATSLGTVTTDAIAASNSISPDVDVDMYSFTVAAGQTVDFDIDTTQNGTGGLDSYIRLFTVQGRQLDFNNDGMAPGGIVVGFDSYLRYTFATSGTYYLAVSNLHNITYDPFTGSGDASGGLDATGAYQLTITALPIDSDDAISEATSLGTISTTAVTKSSDIVTDIDVDMYRFTVTAGQIVDFDIDTPLNGPAGLGSYIRIFNAQGTQIDFNDDAAAPGEGPVGIDSYLRHTFASSGTYYVGVSNSNNVTYSATTGDGDTAGGPSSVGNYSLSVKAVFLGPPELQVNLSAASMPEVGGTATGTITRINTNTGSPLTVNLASSDSTQATVVSSIVIPAGQSSATFQVVAVHNTTQGTTAVNITATATDFAAVTQSILVTDGDGTWHNSLNPNDVDNDGNISPLDVLAIINFINLNGTGPVPPGSPPPYLDVDADNQITPLDVLILVNYLNTKASGGGAEGEATQGDVFQGAASSVETNRTVDAVYSQYGQGILPEFDSLDTRGKRRFG